MLAFFLCGSVVNSCLKITRVENAKSHGLSIQLTENIGKIRKTDDVCHLIRSCIPGEILYQLCNSKSVKTRLMMRKLTLFLFLKVLYFSGAMSKSKRKGTAFAVPYG